MASSEWTTKDIPNQRGKLAVVTGGNSGIGYEAALALAAKGARVILAVRNAEKGRAAGAARERFRARAAERSRECLQLAVALRAAAERMHAAAMAPPRPGVQAGRVA